MGEWGWPRALGFRFLDAAGNELDPGGGALAKLAKIDGGNVHPLLESAAFHVACDVDNPLLGEQGASRIYGPKKEQRPRWWMYLMPR